MNEYSEAFAYPSEPHVRRHEPYGYTDYKSYREWLRDEFSFRCVFCLRRERWEPRRAMFHIDHLVPQSTAPERACDYRNLLYVCAGCNSIKTDREFPDPCQIGFGKCLRVQRDGRIEPLTETGRFLVDVLRLDDEEWTQYRKKYLDALQSMIDNDQRDRYIQWMGYPDDLCDLSRQRPPGNRRPEGIEQSHFARKQRGELPETY